MVQSLLNYKKGDMGTVKKIDAGTEATRRLYEMGFYTGAPINVIKNDAGPVILCLKGNKVALGRGLAAKILLEG